MEVDERSNGQSSEEDGNATSTFVADPMRHSSRLSDVVETEVTSQQTSMTSSDSNDPNVFSTQSDGTQVVRSMPVCPNININGNKRNVIPDRPIEDVARDTKRILEICYGNGSKTVATVATVDAVVPNKDSIELKCIELNPKPKKKKGTKSSTTASSTKKKKSSGSTQKKKKAEGSERSSEDTDESNDPSKEGGEGDPHKKKRKKKAKIITITKTITNEDGTTTTVVVKKRRKRKKKKPAIKRDAAGRIVRKRRKIKNRHRVVKKELIKKGKDAKIDLPTIEECGSSSEEEDSSCSSGSSDSGSDYEYSTGDSSQYTLETIYTYDSGDDDIVDSDEEENEMMVLYEDEEEENDDGQEIVVEGFPCSEKAAVDGTSNGDTAGTASTIESLTPNLGGKIGSMQKLDLEAASTPGPKSDSAVLEQPKERSFESAAPTEADTEVDSNQRKGISYWGRRKLILVGSALVAIVAGIVILIVYFAASSKNEHTGAPSMAPTIATDAPSPTPSAMPTFEPTGILNTSSTICELPSDETDVLVLQAENANFFFGSTTDGNETSGFCGEGYATDFLDEESSIVFYPLELNRTGFYMLEIRYSNGEDRDLPLRLRINEQDVGVFSMIPTGDWSTWMVEGIDGILLREGSNHSMEVLTADTKNMGPNVDWISLRFQDSLTRFEYLTSILALLTNIAAPSPAQIAALVWMSSEDPINWDTLTDQEIIERYSLVQFYRSTEGDLWITDNEWLSGLHVCNWYGISCSEDQFVTDLILDENGVYGSIPEDLFLLTNLVTVSLNTNSLEGTLGSAFGRLRNLESLLLGANFLSGPLPDEIGNLANLTILDLSANDLDGDIPPELYDLVSLRVLVLSSNDFAGSLAPDIHKMSALKEINVQSNTLTGAIPTELGLLTELTSLLLGFNFFSGTIPSELGLLTNLVFLDLNTNQLTGQVPHELQALNGTVIDYYGNAVRNPR
ncbi:two component regulator [Nitzschia inconspicua]|uniref:Two component regulator n=1 Tax=Nitzschia inconspicua TaxID=303405 RepID=A0A9K3LH45_9STRA|nr:two component regulator [Nitzschia inconspicua]